VEETDTAIMTMQHASVLLTLLVLIAQAKDHPLKTTLLVEPLFNTFPEKEDSESEFLPELQLLHSLLLPSFSS